MTDARAQQLIAGVLALTALIGFIVLTAVGVTTEATNALLGGTVTTLLGFLIGNVKTNGVAGSKTIADAQAVRDVVAATKQDAQAVAVTMGAVRDQGAPPTT